MKQRLKSSDIKWEDGMDYAVVSFGEIHTTQYKAHPSLGCHFTEEFHYVIDREHELRLNYFRSLGGIIAVADKVNINGDILTVRPVDLAKINDDHFVNELITIESFGFRGSCHGQSKMKSLPIIVDKKEIPAEDADWKR